MAKASKKPEPSKPAIAAPGQSELERLLPNGVLHNMLTYLKPKDLAQMAGVSCRMRDVVGDSYFWLHHVMFREDPADTTEDNASSQDADVQAEEAEPTSEQDKVLAMELRKIAERKAHNRVKFLRQQILIARHKVLLRDTLNQFLNATTWHDSMDYRDQLLALEPKLKPSIDLVHREKFEVFDRIRRHREVQARRWHKITFGLLIATMGCLGLPLLLNPLFAIIPAVFVVLTIFAAFRSSRLRDALSDERKASVIKSRYSSSEQLIERGCSEEFAAILDEEIEDVEKLEHSLEAFEKRSVADAPQSTADKVLGDQSTSSDQTPQESPTSHAGFRPLFASPGEDLHGEKPIPSAPPVDNLPAILVGAGS